MVDFFLSWVHEDMMDTSASNVLERLQAEKNSLDSSFIHCTRLLDEGELYNLIGEIVIF